MTLLSNATLTTATTTRTFFQTKSQIAAVRMYVVFDRCTAKCKLKQKKKIVANSDATAIGVNPKRQLSSDFRCSLTST